MQGTRAKHKGLCFAPSMLVVALAKEAAEGGFFPEGKQACKRARSGKPFDLVALTAKRLILQEGFSSSSSSAF